MSQLFNSLGQKKQMQPQNPMQAVQQLKSDPVGFLKSRGINIPDGVDAKNPQAIVNSLLQSGQIPNNRYQQVMQIMQRMGRR